MNIKNLYFLVLVAACMTATAATASVNKFFIDDLRLTPDASGTRITIPVKASFETPVSTWDVKFVLSEGLNLISISRGSDMSINYINSHGTEQSCSATFIANKDRARAIGSTFGESVYDDDHSVINQLKWNAGTYDEMMVLTVDISQDCLGGTIEIMSETACGYDTDPIGLIPDTLTYDNNEEEYYYKGDVNLDGSIDVFDVTMIMSYILDTFSEFDFLPITADINFDGIVDVRDIVELLDFLIHWDSWYTGYQNNACTTSAEIIIPVEYPYLNQLYIPDFMIAPEDLGHEITIPVMAYFEGCVSTWEAEFEFPEGLTPIDFSPGSNMTINYCDYRGRQSTYPAWIAHNNDFTHFVSTIIVDNNIPVGDGIYEMAGTAKWEPGEYMEMLLLTVRVDETFREGAINIHTKTTFGKDLRYDFLFYPVTMEYPDDQGWWPGDVNGDCVDDVYDVSNLMCYFVDPDYAPLYEYMSGDIHVDGEVDLRDMQKLIDYLFWGEWYEWYTLSSEQSTCNIMAVMPSIPGDMDGDGELSVTDITTIIDLLLNGGAPSANADVNNDGIVDIDDVTTLITKVLNGE